MLLGNRVRSEVASADLSLLSFGSHLSGSRASMFEYAHSDSSPERKKGLGSILSKTFKSNSAHSSPLAGLLSSFATTIGSGKKLEVCYVVSK